MSASAFAPGKIILMGEHAVVHGHKALAMAVDRGMTVRLEERPGPTQLDSPSIHDPRMDAALRCVLPETGVGVHIHSTLPIGRGMGSSAALAVALARSALKREGRPPTHDAVNAHAFAVERVFHGAPSGIDHTVSMHGGAMLYQRNEAGPTFEPIELPPLPIVVIDSGTAGNTATMVAKVANNIVGNAAHLAAMGDLLAQSLPALQRGDDTAIGEAWRENHRLLQAIGVSTPTIDTIVNAAIEAGATGAKLAGAGGGGIVIALAPDPQAVCSAATQRGWNAFPVAQAPSLAQPVQP